MSRSAEGRDVNLLDLAPVCRAEFEETGDRVVVVRPKNHRPGAAGLLDRLTWSLSAKRIRLDAVGSFIWRRLDGKTTVREIAQAMRDELGETVEPVEERLGTFLHQLHRQELVAFPPLDAI